MTGRRKHGLISGSGTKRTNRAGLAMSVVRVDQKWQADCQTDAIDPNRTWGLAQ
jgi:hypothetical protein